MTAAEGEMVFPGLVCSNEDTLFAGGCLSHPELATHVRRPFLWLFLFLNCVFILTSSGRVRIIDEVLPVYQTESIVERGSTAIPQAAGAQLFYGKRDSQGRPQAPYPPGPALLAVPWYLAGRSVLASLPGVPQSAEALVTDFSIVLSSATYAALAASLMFLVFIGMGVAQKRALLGALALAFATPLFCYSAWYFSEPLAAALFLSATVALFVRPASEDFSARGCLLAGLALGATLWVRPTHLLTALVFLAAILASERGWTCRLRAAAIVAAVLGAFGAAYLLRNGMLYGNVFDFGYPAAAEGGRRLNTFETPLLTGIMAFLFSPGKSVFLFAPPLLLASWGLPRIWRQNRGLAVVLGGAPLVSLLFFSRYTQFEGGYAFGPRYLVPGMMLLACAVGVVLREGSGTQRKLLLALCLAGMLVNVIGLATSPLEDMASGKYYDEQFNYRLDYSPLAGQGALLVKYLSDAAPAAIGRGFDRWFVFLHKGGVSTGWLLLVGGLATAGAAFSAVRLLRSVGQRSSG